MFKKFSNFLIILLFTIFITFVFSKPPYINSDFKHLFVLSVLILGIIIIILDKYKFKLIYPVAIIGTVLINFLIIDLCFSIVKIFGVPKIDIFSNLAIKNNVYFDKRTSKGLIRDLEKSSNKKYFPIIPNADLLRDKDFKNLLPLSDLSNVNTVYCNESGERVIYKSNNFGFRSSNLFEKKNKKDNSNNNFWLLGDSYTQGACVDDEYTIDTLMKIYFKNKNIYSFGQGASSLLFQYGIFREYIKSNLKADDVVFVFHYPNNDYNDIISESKNKILINYLNNNNFSQDLLLNSKNNEKDKILKEYISNKFRGNKNLFGEKNRFKDFTNPLKFEKLFDFLVKNIIKDIRELKGQEIYIKVFDKLLNDLEEKNAKLVLVCVPSYQDLFSFNSNKFNNTCAKASRILKSNYKKNNFTYIDVTSKMSKNSLNELFPFGNNLTHFSGKGYKEFIRYIAEELENRNYKKS